MALFGGATTDTTGASEPTWPSTVGPIVFDGDVEWKAIKQYWISEHTYATNAIINPYSGQIFKATTGGTSGTSEPNWTAGGAVTDGDITWTPITSTDLAESANANREIYFDRFRTQMQEVNSVAGVSPNFESAGTNGDGCWQDDPSAQFWFESQDGLLPMFVDHDYHSSKLVIDEDGRPFAQSTMEFYVELQWGCPDKLKLGDQITITLEGVAGGAVTYQQGDEWDVSVAHADPLQLGGGQDGDDTLTWSVTSSIGTAFDPYELITTALAAYDDGGLTFAITPGAIDFALGDTFRLSVEGGHFRWRRDGGSWSSSTVIGDTSASDGLTIEFVGGAAPSWVGGDAWSFSAEATNGPDQAKSPTDGRFKWTGSTTLTIVPDSSGPVTRLAIYDHHIPSDAAIRLQGSDDDFSTTPTDIAITWAERNILAIFPSVTRAKWRITVDKGGDLFWAFLGDTMQPTTPNGAREAGKFVKRRRVPRLGIRGGIAGDISHEAVSQTSFEDFMTGIDYAGANDAGAFGLVLNDALGETSLVRFTGTDVEASDLRGYQSSDADLRWHSFTLPVEALP